MLDHTPRPISEIHDFPDGVGTHRDNRPAALFQAYETSADPVGKCYDARHLLLGPAADTPGTAGRRGVREGSTPGRGGHDCALPRERVKLLLREAHRTSLPPRP
ncbi:hypothetical protein ACFV3E_38245 [Streptomyces sp. NPDC059718]